MAAKKSRFVARLMGETRGDKFVWWVVFFLLLVGYLVGSGVVG